MINEQYVYRYMDKDSLHHMWNHMKAEEWFSETELAISSNFRNRIRREEWILGRLLAKQLILENVDKMSIYPSEIQIYSRSGLGNPMRPQIMMNGRLLDRLLSIAHSKQSVLVALSKNPKALIGADIESLQMQGPYFSAIWLTKHEQDWLQAQGKPHLVSVIWAIKEAAYKAININHRFIPRRIEAHFNKLGDCSLLFDGKKLDQGHNVYIAEINNEVITIVTIVSENTREGSPIIRSKIYDRSNRSCCISDW